MKKNVKIILVFIILISLTKVCFAGNYVIIPDVFSATYDTDISKAEALGETILGYIVNIAAISSVVIIAFLGLKFMIGSVEQRAEYKKSFIPLIVGMFVVLGASMIVGIFYDNFACIHEFPHGSCGGEQRCMKCGKIQVFPEHDFSVDIHGFKYCSVCGVCQQ